MNRRLCMAVHGPYPVGEPRVEREALAALAAGWDVDVIAMRRAGELSSEVVEGIRVIRLPMAHRRGLGPLGMVVEYLGFTLLTTGRLARSQRYDVIQVNTPPDFLIAATFIPRLRRSRVILDVHDLSSDMFKMRFGDRRGSGLVERALRWMERTAGRLSTSVVTVHEPYREELVARGVRESKIVVVMNSIDESRLPPPANGNSEGFRVVYHGTVTPRYGLDQLIEAATYLEPAIEDMKIEIYGEGDAVPQLRSQATALGLDGVVFVNGEHLSQTEVLSRVQTANVGVVCTSLQADRDLGLPTKLLEYARLGIPVVSADIRIVREHFSDDEILYFESGNPRDLARALEQVARNPSEAKKRADAARQRYEEYCWPIQSRRYIELLERLVPSSY